MKGFSKCRYQFPFFGLLSFSFVILFYGIAYGGTGKFDPATGKFDFVVSVRFNATDAQIQMIKDRFTEGSAILFDATDGQHQFGKITICNNSRAGRAAEYWIVPDCGTSSATFGEYGKAGKHVTLYFCRIEDTVTGQYTIAHEHAHHAYDIRDEYSGSGGAAICVEDPPDPTTLTVCLMDNFKTRGGRSVAGGQPTLNEFCVTSNHDPDKDTFQHGKHKEACWNTISKSRFPATAPSGLPVDAPPVVTAPTFPNVDPEGRFVMIIDRSGSMTIENRIDVAKIGGNQFVELALDGDKLGVVSFATTASTNFPLTVVDATAKAGAKAAINALSASGNTAIGAGLQTAENLLPASQRACLETFILLSDGFHNSGIHPNTILPSLKAKGIIVHTIGVGNDVDEGLLRSIASTTGGMFFRTVDAFGIQSIFAALSTETQEGGIFAKEPGTIATGETKTIPAQVDAQTKRATFVLNWNGSAFNLDLTLRKPNGAIITPADAVGNPNITFISGSAYEIFMINTPDVGMWEIISTGVSAAGGVKFEALGLSDAANTGLLVTANQDVFAFPEPILVKAEPFALDVPIVNAEVTGTVTRPEGSSVPITLFDDGLSIHGDEIANDGIYSNFFSNFSEDGTYTFNLTAVNRNGSLAQGEKIDTEVDTRVPDPFTRLSSVAVIVTGVPDVLPPTANAGQDKETCSGQPIMIGGDPTASGGNGGPYTFSWSPGTSLDDSTAANPNASPTVTTAYTVTVTETSTGLTATDQVLVTVNPLPTANAGVDRNICLGQTIVIGGNPTATGGTPPYSISWTPTTGLNNSNAPNPKVRPIITTPYIVTVTDAKGCQDKDTVMVNVHEEVFVSNESIHLQAPRISSGNLHANGSINFQIGRPSFLRGNLEAVNDILIRTDNTITGDATAGKHISILGNAKVTGTVKITPVRRITLPVLSFIAGGKNITVGQTKSLTLPPGSYGEVKVLNGGKLYLMSGEYFMKKFEMNGSTLLTCDVTAGPITVNIVDNFKFGQKAQVVITPAGSTATAQVGFLTMTKASIEIGVQSVVRGAIIAPNASVTLQRDSQFKGSICAGKIDVHNGARFFHHYSVSLTKETEIEEFEISESEITESEVEPVTNYQLEQNYPNPFNPSTQISFALPEAGKVTVNIFNETGQLVRTLTDGEMPAGRHELRWNGADQSGNIVAAGVYLYRIVVTGKTGDVVFTETKRMTFLK